MSSNFKKFSLPLAKFIQVEANPLKQDEIIVVKLIQGRKSEEKNSALSRTSSIKRQDGLLALVEFWQIDDKTLNDLKFIKALEFEDPVLRQIEVNG